MAKDDFRSECMCGKQDYCANPASCASRALGAFRRVSVDDLGVLQPPKVQPTAPQHAAPLSEAVTLLRKGAALPRTLITALLDEGHDITGLIRSIKPASA